MIRVLVAEGHTFLICVGEKWKKKVGFTVLGHLNCIKLGNIILKGIK